MRRASSLFRPRRSALPRAAGFFCCLAGIKIASRFMWHLDAARARLVQNDVQAEVDLSQPASGLTGLTRAGRSVAHDLRLFAIEISSGALGEPADCYIRGTDLVVTYPPQPSDPVATQVYWREVPEASDALLALELIVSRQTHLLDSDPRIFVTSEIPAEAAWRLGGTAGAAQSLQSLEPTELHLIESPQPGAFLLQQPEGELSWGVLVHPSDFRTARCKADGPQIRLSCELFQERLEKGVIRRGRLHVRLWHRVIAERRLIETYATIRDEPPPLTT